MRRRALPGAVVAAVGAIALSAACNALVGNDDIRFSTGTEPLDATTKAEASVESGVTIDAGVDEPSVGTGDADAAPVVMVDAASTCEAGTKFCNGACVTFDDPGYGCGPTHCSPCELPNAIAGCALPDGGPDGGPLTCSVAVCKANHADCNGTPLDGCEIDTEDLYDCGGCGHDCTALPNVAGNVGCTNGVCTFDGASCAPTFGICSTNPDDGCDTEFSLAAHCGNCTTVCAGGTPDCSKTNDPSQPFACTSGCAPGLSLCGAQCVDEQTDPTHCGSCTSQCPAVAGGTPTCSPGGVCGFTCNANDHVCGTGSGATCAANNDANNCGVGAACGQCTAPASATPTCTGGTTCGFTCVPGTSLCGSACVDLQADDNNCGACGNACDAGQTCSDSQCACNATSCPSGCCDGSGTCRTTGMACRSGGATCACASGCPLALPESQQLVLWLVGDAYSSGATVWTDESGHADATCSSCPSVGSLDGHGAVSFDGSSYFALGDPGGLYQTTAFTVFLVAAPASSAASNAVIVGFSDGNGDALSLQRSGSAPDLMMQLLPGSSTDSIVASGAWADTAESIAATVNASGAVLTVGGADNTGAIGTPANVDYASSYLGTDPATKTATFTGQIAEVIVFDTVLSSTSIASVKSYITGRYGL